MGLNTEKGSFNFLTAIFMKGVLWRIKLMEKENILGPMENFTLEIMNIMYKKGKECITGPVDSIMKAI